MQESELRISASCLFEAEVYDVAFLNFLRLAETTDLGKDWYQVGYSALALDGCSKALEAFERAKAKEPNSSNPQVDAMIALLCSASPIQEDRDGNRALAIAKSLLHEQCDQWKTETLLAAAYAEIGDFNTANRRLEEALNRCPEDQKPEICFRRIQYNNRQPFRIDIKYIRQRLRGFRKCIRCNANTNISQRSYCVRCIETLGRLEKNSD